MIIPIDINECSDGSSNCTTDSTCLNTQGSYSCICPEGYSGDGRQDGDGCRGTFMVIIIVRISSESLIGLLALVYS